MSGRKQEMKDCMVPNCRGGSDRQLRIFKVPQPNRKVYCEKAQVTFVEEYEYYICERHFNTSQPTRTSLSLSDIPTENLSMTYSVPAADAAATSAANRSALRSALYSAVYSSAYSASYDAIRYVTRPTHRDTSRAITRATNYATTYAKGYACGFKAGFDRGCAEAATTNNSGNAASPPPGNQRP